MTDSLKTNPSINPMNSTNSITPLDCSKADTGVWLVKVARIFFSLNFSALKFKI